MLKMILITDLESIEGILSTLLFITPKRQLLYLTDVRGKDEFPDNQMEHLGCYLPGVLALGAYRLDLPKETKERHQWAAEGLAYTCWVVYNEQASGLGPDNAKMTNGGKWVDAVKKWEQAGRPTGKPPGVRSPPPERDANQREYYNTWGGQWLMRPEVGPEYHYFDVKLKHDGSDGGKPVLDVEDDGRCGVARTRLLHLSGNTKAHKDRVRLLKRQQRRQ